MLSILGVLVLTSPAFAMIRPADTGMDSNQEDNTSLDPNTHWTLGEGEPPTHRAGPLLMPPLGKRDGGPDGAVFDTTGPGVLPVPDPTICDLLLNAPVPVPIDQIPVFCLCSHCQGGQGAKGDQGDRGPPGTTSNRHPASLTLGCCSAEA